MISSFLWSVRLMAFSFLNILCVPFVCLFLGFPIKIRVGSPNDYHLVNKLTKILVNVVLACLAVRHSRSLFLGSEVKISSLSHQLLRNTNQNWRLQGPRLDFLAFCLKNTLGWFVVDPRRIYQVNIGSWVLAVSKTWDKIKILKISNKIMISS